MLNVPLLRNNGLIASILPPPSFRPLNGSDIIVYTDRMHVCQRRGAFRCVRMRGFSSGLAVTRIYPYPATYYPN